MWSISELTVTGNNQVLTEKPVPAPHLHQKSYLNRGLQGQRMATNNLSQGMVLQIK